MRPEAKRILCVEPSADVSTMLRFLIRSRGFYCDAASTITEAFEKAAAGEFDLFIVDDYYTDGTNRELIRGLRALKPAAPVLVFSTQDFVESRAAALEAGASDYFIQPGDLALVLGAVERLCGVAPAPQA